MQDRQKPSQELLANPAGRIKASEWTYVSG